VRHPSEYYVRYLLATSWGDQDQPLTLELLNEALTDCGLLEMIDRQWSRLLSIFQAPEDFLFNNFHHPPTLEFMKRGKIYTLWVSSSAMNRVLTEIVGEHGDHSYQHDLHILLMGDVPPAIIAEKISKKYRLQTSLTEEMIILYEHYFWRRKNLTRVEWAEFLKDSPNFDDYMAPLLCGEQQALFRAGMNPKYDYKQSLRDSHRQVSFRIQYLGYKQDDKHTNADFTKLSNEQRALYNVLYGDGGGYEEKLKEVRHWIMEHRDPAIKAISDLIGPDGSYSGDGKDSAPTQKPEEEETKP
jgi:hypothetical protein